MFYLKLEEYELSTILYERIISNSSRLLVAPFPKSMNNFDENLINLI